MYNLPKPYLIYLGRSQTKYSAKIADALMTWSKDDVKSYYAHPDCKVKYDLPFTTPEEAVKYGVKSLVIAFANSGGFLTDEDIKIAARALKSGLNVISGMHKKLEDYPEIKEALKITKAKVFNLRFHNIELKTDDSEKRPGKRILTVGTDCSVGKMFATLALDAELKNRQLKSKFCATGQTGIILSGEGIAIDAVIADFISGAAAYLSPATNELDYYVIEGQGSLHHPSFAGVSLGLLHGSQPDHLVLCHDHLRTKMRHTNFNLPSIDETIELNLITAKRVNPNVCFKGIVLNLSGIDNLEEKHKIRDFYEDKYNLPVSDIFSINIRNIVDNILKH